jgi:hypothetical protein
MFILLLTTLACAPSPCADTLLVTVVSSGGTPLDTYQIAIEDESQAVIAAATCGDHAFDDAITNATCRDDGRVELYVPPEPSYHVNAGVLATDSDWFAGDVEIDWMPNADANCQSAAIKIQLQSCGDSCG